MKKSVIAALIAMIGVLALACSSASDYIPPTPPAPVPGPGQGGPILTLTDEQRIAVLNECGAFADALGDLRSDATQQALVTYLKSRGEFGDAGAVGGNVWAYFHDGRLVSFIPDWLDKDAETGGRLPTPDISGGRSGTENALRNGVPGGKKVMLFHGLGKAYDDNRPYLAEIFLKSHTKYIVEGKDATIENLKTVKNVDVFYINTHGGFGYLGAVTSSELEWSLWTSNILSVAGEILYRADLDRKVLSYIYALEDVGVFNREINEWHYGITGKFVYEHMTFTENSLLYLDACNSLTDLSNNFRGIMMGRAENSATTYIGWKGVTDGGVAFPTSWYIFDRLLGAPVYMLESPPQRPFDLDPIISQLPKYNLGLSSYGAKLDYESSLDAEIILTPSIEYITIDDYNSTMTIEGMFGDNSLNDGKVTVGGMTVHYDPSDWSPNQIICDLPVAGPGSSGDVIVTVNGHESNKVPLSEWTIPLHLVRDDFGVKVDTRLNLKIRADVHRYRTKPEEVPKSDRPDLPVPLPASLGFPCSVASTGTYTVGGQRTAYCVKDKCTMRDTESAVGRSGSLPFAIVNQSLGFGAFYKWSTDMKKLEVYVVVNIPDNGMEIETYTSCEGSSPVTTTKSVSTTLGIFTVKPLVFNLDANFSIAAGDIPSMENIPWGRCESPGYFKQTATWPTVMPTSKPTSDTDARNAIGD